MSGLRGLGRALLLFAIRLLFRAAPKPAPKLDPSRIRRVLVVRTDPRVGNVLLTTPLVRALRQGLPGARVDWLVAAGKENLVAGLADRILPFQKRDLFRAPWRFFAFVLALRREGYDVAIDAGHWHAFSFTSLWATRFSGAPVRIGHRRGLSERFLTHEVEHAVEVEREVPAKLELLRPLGIAAAGEGLDTTVDRDPAARALAQQICGAAPAGPLVGLNPGARKADHRWPPEAFAALAVRLRQEVGATSLVLWGPGEEELARAVASASEGAARLAPPTNLAALAAVFRHCALVVTNDTGPMHLAVACGAPVAAVLLAQDGGRWSHRGRFAGVAVRTASPQDVEKVFEAARWLLSGAAAA
ncbi:MAG: glycosyltransferase family 9 protein [Deltaproteobacteria bacterium]|nr:glycosyltransferase family 9 protein [Deltaproteobacteria bacterium]